MRQLRAQRLPVATFYMEKVGCSLSTFDIQKRGSEQERFGMDLNIPDATGRTGKDGVRKEGHGLARKTGHGLHISKCYRSCFTRCSITFAVCGWLLL